MQELKAALTNFVGYWVTIMGESADLGNVTAIKQGKSERHGLRDVAPGFDDLTDS
jgi:hypothetical protein